jgi:hypothetical protein
MRAQPVRVGVGSMPVLVQIVDPDAIFIFVTPPVRG